MARARGEENWNAPYVLPKTCRRPICHILKASVAHPQDAACILTVDHASEEIHRTPMSDNVLTFAIHQYESVLKKLLRAAGLDWIVLLQRSVYLTILVGAWCAFTSWVTDSSRHELLLLLLLQGIVSNQLSFGKHGKQACKVIGGYRKSNINHGIRGGRQIPDKMEHESLDFIQIWSSAKCEGSEALGANERGGKVEANGATFTKMGSTLQEGAHFWVHTSFLGPEGACVM
ncbi:hypothetical protein BJV77DRAFT_959974 [Russula vinacea]|nr:hypothetical protein BJV77DRAFT_959974 [Russula vinacea]